MPNLIFSTDRDGLVLDGFVGSGTTLIAAERAGRRAFGLECEPRYVDLTLHRFRKFTGIEPLHVKTGLTLEELARARPTQARPIGRPTAQKKDEGDETATDKGESTTHGQYQETAAQESDASDYKIGHGKPPRHSQFKPGQSGYPKGRPKGSRNFKTAVKATLKAPVKVTRDGKSRKVSTLEAMLLRLREKALGGDLRALDRLLQLAQAYSEDELAAAVGLSADDANVLRIYRARVLSGAAAGSDLIDDNDNPKAIQADRSP